MAIKKIKSPLVDVDMMNLRSAKRSVRWYKCQEFAKNIYHSTLKDGELHSFAEMCLDLIPPQGNKLADVFGGK